MLISSFLKISSRFAFSVFITLPRRGNIAWNFLSLPCFAEPPAESPSTRKSSFLFLFLDCAGVNFPDRARSFLLFVLPFLASSLAFLAASLAILLFSDLSKISVATFLFSSKKNCNFSLTIVSTTVRARGVPSLPFVWPSNCKSASGIFKLIIAVNPSLTSLPSNGLSLVLT